MLVEIRRDLMDLQEYGRYSFEQIRQYAIAESGYIDPMRQELVLKRQLPVYRVFSRTRKTNAG